MFRGTYDTLILSRNKAYFPQIFLTFLHRWLHNYLHTLFFKFVTEDLGILEHTLWTLKGFLHVKTAKCCLHRDKREVVVVKFMYCQSYFTWNSWCWYGLPEPMSLTSTTQGQVVICCYFLYNERRTSVKVASKATTAGLCTVCNQRMQFLIPWACSFPNHLVFVNV
jgi:hypothetical protein